MPLRMSPGRMKHVAKELEQITPDNVFTRIKQLFPSELQKTHKSEATIRRKLHEL